MDNEGVAKKICLETRGSDEDADGSTDHGNNKADEPPAQ
jgi:hypothetical protein